MRGKGWQDVTGHPLSLLRSYPVVSAKQLVSVAKVQRAIRQPQEVLISGRINGWLVRCNPCEASCSWPLSELTAAPMRVAVQWQDDAPFFVTCRLDPRYRGFTF
jgi:hypothetical protein